ncbi:protein of unknown function DUF1885 [Paenibacillus curdlanolyticus YK9]|uniref:DUF1885 family protein n=1 Tax=Paenibacillus curdlanolyticus YK9 TaxID=717606 RepID=E0I3L5_9BACL|nr:DUF1885 family protein [Paenibacillus curdlanolyticus]EFM12879.1 protein of unknown function DUF1885 [Paenibacillus curdlanolyticus YK9]
MSKTAYIRLVQGSTAPDGLTLDDLQLSLHAYQDAVRRTGFQLDWNYEEAAFPYSIEPVTPPNESIPQWLYLRGKASRYRHIAIGVGTADTSPSLETVNSTPYIQVVLPDGSTHADHAKANELCRFIAERLKAELQLFNGRIMYYNPRK